MSEPYWQDETVALYLGDCVAVLADLPDSSVDAVVTDPPYGLEFMGKEWDGADGFRRSLNPADTGRNNVFGRASRTSPEYRTAKPSSARMRTRRDDRTNPAEGKSVTTTPEAYVAGNVYQEWCQAWAAECLRVLKPGGFMLAFGGTRTYHRLACGIEDAGFEIRDSMHWIYGSGFPKSLDVSKVIDKDAGIWRGRRGDQESANDSMSGANYERTAKGNPATAAAAAAWSGWGTALKPAHEPIVVARKPLAGTVAQNVLEHGTGALNIDGCRVAGEAVRTTRNTALGIMNDDGWQPKPAVFESHDAGRWPPNILLGPDAAAELDAQSGYMEGGNRPARRGGIGYGSGAGGTNDGVAIGYDSGGASRFFPVFRYEAKAATSERPRGDDGTAHPTVKPVDLMAWLVRLVTPPGGLVLDPFAGSGTTAEACIVEGFRCLLIEKDPAYAELIRKRLRKDIQPSMFGGAA